MRILLINPPTSFDQIYGDWDLSSLDTYSPPLGILYIASFIKEYQHEPYVLDLEAIKWNVDKVSDFIHAWDPCLIGITSMTINFMNAQKIATFLKEKFNSIPIALGGAHITATPLETMTNYSCFDFGIIGEGERTFLELIEKFKNYDSLKEIEGIIWRDDDNRIIINEGRPVIENLDILPFPAWDLLKGFPDKYPLSILESKRLPAASIMTSRGCPYNCTFCDNRIFGTKVRHFSADYSTRMIDYLINNFGIKDIMILDDNFLLNNKKLFSICNYLIDKKINLTWYCMGHANTMTKEKLMKIKEAGCWFIELGIESGNDNILRNIKKNTTKEEIAKAVKLAKQAGLKVKGNFIFGFPGDTIKTLKESTNFALKIKIDFFQQNFLTVWPGCEIYNQIKENNNIYEYYDSSWVSLAHQRVTFIPKGLSKGEMVSASKSAFRRFYLRPRIILGLLPLVFSKRGIKFLFIAFCTFLKTIFRKSNE